MVTRSTKKAWKPNLSKRVKITVTSPDIEAGKACDPNKCMIKLSTARAINLPHGYIKVDATGVAITRRNDYREKAFIPNKVIAKLLMFDKEKTRNLVKPFTFWLEFHKTSKVYKSSDERKKKVNANRQRRKAEGRPDKHYDLHTRVHGLAVSKDVAEILKQATA